MSTALMHAIFLDIQAGDKKYVGFTIDGLRARGVPEAAILAGLQEHLRRMVDEVAETTRLGLVTPGAGQAMEYGAAQAEAVAALAAPDTATAERYPMLAASIDIDTDPQTGEAATDVLGVARSVQAARDAWVRIGAAIRGARLTGKAAIGAATTIEEATAAHAAITWPAMPR